MSRIVAATVVSLVAGFAAGAWWLGGGPASDTETTRDSAAAVTDPSLSPADRLKQLELAVAQERAARMVLEDQLRVLIDEIERVESAGQSVVVERAGQEQATRQAARRGRSESPNFSTMMRDFQARRVNVLTKGGYAEDEAREVLRLESEAQYQAILNAHEAERNGAASGSTSSYSGAQQLLRAELGDDEYARYLQAQGHPAAIQVTQVMEGSPGSLAGLQPGDEIVSYNGERVFGDDDLRSLTLQGTLGEDVVVEIDRDGVRMQLNLQRGPIGIRGANNRVRLGGWWSGN